MPRFLLLRLEGPLLAFGGETVDAYGVVVDFPAASMLTGLIASALGWRRSERDRLARLQDRLVFGARIDREGTRLVDLQNAQLFEDESGWTTRGRVESRAKSPSYGRGRNGRKTLTHQRWRSYDADKAVTVALHLGDEAEPPTLDECATALKDPARPLFLGRKSCAPSGPLFLALVEAESLLAALLDCRLAAKEDASPIRVMLPASDPGEPGDETRPVTDERDWHSGVHGGRRLVRIRALPPDRFATPDPAPGGPPR